MAAQATQLLVRTGSSPKTPGNTTLPLHITPLDTVESDHNPNTPHKDLTQKKKSGKLASKRKLFHQNGQSIQILNKAKKHSGSNITAVPAPTSRSTEAGPRVHYPLTERQQLQYLLEVTAKDAKQDSGSSSSDDLSAVSNKIRKKDISRENQIDVRVRKKNERGETALHLAAIRGDLEDASALIKAGALVNARDNAGWTPLHEACNYGNLRIVQELVWSGADVNSPGYEAITPLHDAVINDHIKVVKFLLENGADPKLQTSQNYKTADLARSTAVLSLVSPEETARNKYAVSSQKCQDRLQPSPFLDPKVHSQVATTDGLNGSYSERSLYEGGFEPTMHKNVNDDEVPIQLLEHSQNKKMIVHFEEDFGMDSRKHNDGHNFHAQSFESPYGFSRNTWLLASEAEVKESKEKEELHARLSPPEVYEHNGKLAEHLHQAHCYGVEATGMQASGHSKVVNKMVVTEMSPENIGQNHTKESVSSIACSNSQEEFLATETLVQMNARCLSAKKPNTFVTPESEDDTVGPEKINECLDKAIIEISSYLETSQNLNAQEPFDGRDVSKVGLGLLMNDKNVAEDRSVDSNNTSHRPEALSPVNVLCSDYSQGDQQLPPIDQANNTEVKTSESNAINNHLTGNGGESLEQQLVGNFTKIKPRSEKKRDSSGVERNGKSGRRKRTSTRSSESSKHEMNRNLVKEECTNHISNVTWRSELAKHRYSFSNIPVCIPGYEDFLINSRTGSDCSHNEKNKDPTNANQLDKLISQHDTEKIKLRITLEQELVRLFRNDARKAAGYQVPFSACTVITSQMRPGAMEGVSSEKEQPASFKCEVDKILNKFKRLKSDMLRRHNREIEVVIALGYLWNEKEARPSKDTSSQIMRSEDFELLPAKFNEYYEDVLCATD